MVENSQSSECALYLKSQEGATRLMKGIKNKYIALSGVSGSVVLIAPTAIEKDFLRGLFKKDFSDHKQITVSLKRFEAAFIGTRFEGIQLLAVLEAYYGKSLQTRQSSLMTEVETERQFLQSIQENYAANGLSKWLLELYECKMSGGYKFVSALYRSNKAELLSLIASLSHLLRLLESSKEHLLLPVAAAMVTKDPHGLDEGTELMKLFTYYLSDKYPLSERKYREEKTQLLYQAGILNDMGTRLLMTYGLEAYDEKGHALGWASFYKREEPLSLSLLNLEKASRLGYMGSASVFVIENPAVFYTLIKTFPTISAICTSGQVNLCGYHVMDLLVKSGHSLVYSGDFDPEGLLIADRLKARYVGHLTCMGYEQSTYQQILSENLISDSRLKQLEKLVAPELIEVANSMKEIKRAGYQENMIEVLVVEIRERSCQLGE